MSSMQPSSDSSARRVVRTGVVASAIVVLAAGLGGWASVATAQTAARSAAASHASTAFWRDTAVSSQRTSALGARPAVQATKFRGLTLDRTSIGAALAQAPLERSAAARFSPVVLALPDPNGGYQRFTVVESPVMEPALAAKHPNIKTYAGRGIDDPTATLRMDVSQLGFHASVRSHRGGWYIDPLYTLDDSVYVSYLRRDAVNTRPAFAEPFLMEPQIALERGSFRAADAVTVRGAGFAPGAQVRITVRNPATDALPRQTVFATAGNDGTLDASFTADPYKALGSYEITAVDARGSAVTTYRVVADNANPNASVGNQLRTYRLALLTDPAYANYFGGSANVTAAKVALINRVTQVYEDETSIRLVLIGSNDLLNLDTAAQFSGTNGPCGATACYPTASVTCSSATLTRTRTAIGLLVGASNFDVGHIAVGAGGGGIASLGVVGGAAKAQGCTGLPTPTGDLFAVDYVAHEIGHQFAGNHTFNGTVGSCSGGNRSAANSVEPGSGSSVMAYAGICGTDNLQPHSDAYWSQRSFDEIVTFVTGAETTLTEVQVGALRNYTTDGLQFQLRFGGNDSAAIVRGTNFTAAGIQAAIQGIVGWPVTATAAVSGVTDAGFTVTFGGTLANVPVANLQLVNCTGGCSGFVGELTAGGLTARGGTATPLANSAPVVTTTASYTIPLRTPFALTGSATDVDGDTITYMWEQTDRGGATGTSLISNTKLNGPLFRQFGTRAVVSATDTLLYNSPGENLVGTNPTRVFPDLPQVLLNNTNAETGTCPLAGSAPTAAEGDCFSEYLPTAAYVGFAGVNASPLSLNFKLTARDGRGGVNSGTTQLLLATAAGPFLVTAPNTAVTIDGTTATTVTWDVAGTSAAPVSTANVKITLSTDGGLTYPVTLAASTPNTGSRSVVLPNLNTGTARVKVEAVGNVYFDVSNTNFTIRLTGDLNLDGSVSCADVAIVRAALGTTTGQPGFNPVADVNNDGKVNVKDLAYVSQRLPAGTSC